MRSIYTVNPDIRGMMEDIKEIQARIKTGLLNDLFNIFSEIPQGKMTAFETSQRVQEKLQLVGPVIDNLLGESLSPKLMRVYKIMERKGMLPPTPDSMKNVPLGLTFVSILALAAKAASVGGIERLASFIGNLQAVAPTAMDNFNTDSAVQEFNLLLGNPQKILNDEKTIQNIRQQRNQQQQEQHASVTANQDANTAKSGAQAAQVLANTNVGAGQSALSSLLGGGSGFQKI